MIRDPYVEGRAAGWQIVDAPSLEADHTLEADVVIVGSGAGGGTAAEILARSGLRVIMVEEGALKSTRDFKMREAEAYPDLYQESASRKTRDKGINILQGRCVGGSTTVNWTSSFRTPPATLEYWQRNFGLQDLDAEALAPWFAMMERRLNILPWEIKPNENNQVLQRGAAKLGIAVGQISRNVTGCWNLGYCGMGCPTGAKQSMLVSTIPAALAAGAVLLTRARAERLAIFGDQVTALECVAIVANGSPPGLRRITIRAKHYVLAAGAIGSPALLLRSGAPDPHRRLGRRTFLHPSVISAAVMPQEVHGYAGAPQSVYCDHYLERDALDGPLGFKLESPPLHPVLFATTLQGFGSAHARLMREFTHSQALIALVRDGFHPRSQGGTVRLRDDGSPMLDYPLTDVVWEAARRAWLAMAEIQFAAGAKWVAPVHEQSAGYSSWAEARAAIAALALKPQLARVVSAHVMGGCGMSDQPKYGVTNSYGKHHQLANLSVCDGSLFPTSIGANPQLSIYGLAARNVSRLAEVLNGRPAVAIA